VKVLKILAMLVTIGVVCALCALCTVPPIQPKQSIRIVGNSSEGFLLIEPLQPPLLGIEVGLGPPIPKGTLMINCQPDELQTGDGFRPVLLCQNRILIVRGILWQPAK